MNYGLNNDQMLRLECARIAHTDNGARQLYTFITEMAKPKEATKKIVKKPAKK